MAFASAGRGNRVAPSRAAAALRLRRSSTIKTGVEKWERAPRGLRDPMTTSPEFATRPRNHRMDFIFLARLGSERQSFLTLIHSFLPERVVAVSRQALWGFCE